MSRIKKILLITILVAIITILSIITIVHAQEACANTTNVCYGHTLVEDGFGAVEICGECAVCGKPDGICPEKYTDGENETDPDKVSILVKIPKDLRPSAYRENAPYTYNEYTSQSGNIICKQLHPDATCTGTYLKKTNIEDSWSSTGYYCGLPLNSVTTNDAFYMVKCEGVKRTAGCQWCNDPDCTAELTGLSWSNSTNQTTPDAKITVTSNYNYLIEKQVNPDDDGKYFMNGVPYGHIKVTCTKEDYRPVVIDTFIQPGTNVMDCPMTEAYCTSECTIPDDYGTEVCRARCEGINGCTFENTTSTTSGEQYNASEICEGLEPGARVNLEWTDDDHTQILYVNCCNGQFGTGSVSTINLQSNDKVKNLITKTYKKKIKGEPVQLKILVYEKR